MAVTLDRLTHPANHDYRIETGHRRFGLAVGVIGMVIAMAVVVIGIVAAALVGQGDQATTAARWLAVGFGLNTLGLATLKTGIAIVLIGILVRLWLRVDSIKATLPELRAETEPVAIRPGTEDTPFGKAKISVQEPKPLPIHRMAKTMWAPMLLMGVMAVVIGFILSLVWAGNLGTDTGLTASAWTQGLQFLGEGLVLSGISFLLGSILAGLRSGGGEVQEALGLPVKTLTMPATAKAFVVLMMAGLMVSIAQFVLYIVTTGFDSAADVALWFSWLGPLRELGLGLLLAGIVLALATIGKVLGFQFWRIRGIVTTGS
jgi:hypothetical protein